MPVIDTRALQFMIQGDEEMLADMATMFVQFLPDMEARLQIAVADNDAAALHEVAHQLKSRLGYFGAVELQQLAYELEICGRDRKMAATKQMLPPLLAGIDEMLNELRHHTNLALQVCDE